MSTRWAARFLFLAAVVALSTHAPVRGQGAAKEPVSVKFIDRKDGKIQTLEFDLKKESAAGIEVALGKEVRTIPANDIVRVDYIGIPGIKDKLTAAILEEANDQKKALDKYSEMSKQFATASPKAKRYLEYRETVQLAKIAGAKEKKEEFEAESARAAAALENFARTYPTSWEFWPASREAARLYMELGQFDKAAGILSRLAQNKDLGKDLQYEAKLAEAATIFRTGNKTGAELVVEELSKDAGFPKTGPIANKLNALKLVLAVKKPAEGQKPDTKPVTDAIDKMSDPAARGFAYGLLGDLYVQHGLPRDAMWSYLWVVKVYPQDRDERVLAAARLAALFDSMGEKEKADLIREDLLKARTGG